MKKKPEVIDLKKKEVQVEFEKSWNQQQEQKEVIDISDDDDQPGSSKFLPSSSGGSQAYNSWYCFVDPQKLTKSESLFGSGGPAPANSASSGSLFGGQTLQQVTSGVAFGDQQQSGNIFGGDQTTPSVSGGSAAKPAFSGPATFDSPSTGVHIPSKIYFF